MIIHKAPEVEKTVLGTLISFPNTYKPASQVLKPNDFYDSFNAKVYEVIENLNTSRRNVDVLSVFHAMQKTYGTDIAPSEIAALSSLAISPQAIYDQRLIIKEMSMRRQLVLEAQKIIKAVNESKDVFEIIETAKAKFSEIEPITDTGIKNWDMLSDEFIKMLDANANQVQGINTGIEIYDRFSKGEQKGDLKIIAGETSQGKTSLAITEAKNQIDRGVKVAFYSYEMTSQQLMARVIAQETGVSSKELLMTKISDDDYSKVNHALNKDYNLFIIEPKASEYRWLESSIKNVVNNLGVEKVFIDYIQLITIPGLKRHEQIGTIANSLKRLAISAEVNIPITAVSQLNRDSNNPEPELWRLKESGDIENAADVVVGIWRPHHYGIEFMTCSNTEVEAGTAQKGIMKILKGRNIGTAKFAVDWNEQTTRFSDYEEVKKPF